VFRGKALDVLEAFMDEVFAVSFVVEDFEDALADARNAFRVHEAGRAPGNFGHGATVAGYNRTANGLGFQDGEAEALIR
jgi:hypothetical protein